ncbi:MAG TPA: PIG-L deacetylase family protein [Terriglobales bacterium]|nr:PIG-L deacetylase family protein [Terriglobales bacterium]
MIQLGLGGGADQALTFLFLGAHSDDIEIGCGGTILRLAKQYPRSAFGWVVFSAVGDRQAEAQRSARLFVQPPQLSEAVVKPFPDGFLPYVGGEVKAVFEELKRTICPNVVFTHNRKDAHQDHRLIAELTWNTFRDHLILEYEIPKYDGDMGQPNFFVPLEKDAYENKVRFLMEAFSTQRSKRWFDPQTFLGLMRLRGMECNSPSGFAEAFYCRKMVV